MKPKFKIYWNEDGNALFSPLNEPANRLFECRLYWEFRDQTTGKEVKAIGF